MFPKVDQALAQMKFQMTDTDRPLFMHYILTKHYQIGDRLDYYPKYFGYLYKCIWNKI